ncbi:MAG: hypothetical protein ACE5GE_14985, partial [Phycisphaerae bacterium]
MNTRLISIIAGTVFVVLAVVGSILWISFRIYVPPDACAVLTRKMGEALPAGQMVATQPGQKGIQTEVLGPGRYFRNPLVWEAQQVPLTVIPSGDPSTWEWIHSLDDRQRDQLRAGTFKFEGDFPQIGVVSRKV